MSDKHILIILFTMFLSGIKTNAQTAPYNTDSSSKQSNWTYDFQFDQRKAILLKNNFYTTKISAPIYGFVLESTYKKHFRISLATYLSNSNNVNSFLITDPGYVAKIQKWSPDATLINSNNQSGYLVNSSFNIFYITPGFEYIFFTSKWLDLGIPIEIGVGQSKPVLNDFFTKKEIPFINNQRDIIKDKKTFIPLLIGLNPMLNLSPDVIFSASVGYRISLMEGGIGEYFDGLYYQIGLQLIPDEIRKEFKRDMAAWKKKKSEQQLK